MNKLKKLFSPSALAATIATGMLLHATVALATQSCLSQCAYTEPPSCYPGYSCSQYVGGGIGWVYWCCPSSETVGCASAVIGMNCVGPGEAGWVGWCMCNP